MQSPEILLLNRNDFKDHQENIEFGEFVEDNDAKIDEEEISVLKSKINKLTREKNKCTDKDKKSELNDEIQESKNDLKLKEKEIKSNKKDNEYKSQLIKNKEFVNKLQNAFGFLHMRFQEKLYLCGRAVI